jgi:hypothetical protein
VLFKFIHIYIWWFSTNNINAHVDAKGHGELICFAYMCSNAQERSQLETSFVGAHYSVTY